MKHIFQTIILLVTNLTISAGRIHAGNAPDPFSGCGDNSVNTALGCIPTDPSALASGFFKLGIGLTGGIAFMLILYAGVQIMTSAGNPEKMAAAKELAGAAIVGLLFIIFSVFILSIIGVDILGIPDLS